MHVITAIIPVRNRPDRVCEAIDSVVSQTRPPDEILVADDGSEDDTPDRVEALSGVTLLRLPHRGVSAARNAGIAAARGDLIAFLDSDDAWEPEKLALQEAFLIEHPEIPLCHTGEAWFRKGRFVNQKAYHRKEGGRIFRRSLERCLISPSAVMIRASLFDEVGLFDEAMTVCEDYDLWLRVTARHDVGFIDRPLTVKRGGHDDQLSRRYPAMDRYRLDAIEKILDEGILGLEDRKAALAMFARKAAILGQGLRRRGRKEEALALDRRLARLRD